MTIYLTNLATLTLQEAKNTFAGIAGAFAGIVATIVGALQALQALCRHFYKEFLTSNNSSEVLWFLWVFSIHWRHCRHCWDFAGIVGTFVGGLQALQALL